MEKLWYAILFYIFILWDFHFSIRFGNRKKNVHKYFTFIYKGLLWAMLENGDILWIDWGKIENENTEL